MSMRPNAALVSARARSTSASLVTSTGTAATRLCPLSAPAVASASVLSRSQIATAAPDSRKRSTIARPIPWAPPVTTAIRPLRSILLVMRVLAGFRDLARAIDRDVGDARDRRASIGDRHHVELDEQVALALVIGGHPRARRQRVADPRG